MEPRFDETARPERVGPYRLAEAIGRGGMGTVWRAWDERLERQVAVKQIRTDTGLTELRQRLRREARSAARLNHPAIVHIYDLVEDPGGDWIVMELVEGRTLRRLIQTRAACPSRRRCGSRSTSPKGSPKRTLMGFSTAISRRPMSW